MWTGSNAATDYPTPVSQYGSEGSPNSLFTVPDALNTYPGNSSSSGSSPPEASFTDLLFTFGEFNQATPTLRSQELPQIQGDYASSQPRDLYPAEVTHPEEPTSVELEHYSTVVCTTLRNDELIYVAVSMFFLSFSPQMPILHVPSWTPEGKPPILLSAMRAAGALYVRTPRAAAFILNTLETARTTLLVDLVSGYLETPSTFTLLIKGLGQGRWRRHRKDSSHTSHGHLAVYWPLPPRS
jgi:hypothetical protein